MRERIWERMQERMREQIPEPLIGLERSHDKWEGILLGADAGADAGVDFKSCDLSEPIRCAKVSIRSRIRSRERILTNQESQNRERIGKFSKYLTFDSNSTSDS